MTKIAWDTAHAWPNSATTEADSMKTGFDATRTAFDQIKTAADKAKGAFDRAKAASRNSIKATGTPSPGADSVTSPFRTPATPAPKTIDAAIAR